MKSKNTLTISKNVKLKNYCTFHIGGKAKYLIEVYNTSDLIDACKFCNSLNIKYKVIGFGSNVLFDDMGYNGAIIVNRTNIIRFYKDYCFVDSGVAINTIIKKALSKNLSGLEQLIGIPSTIGGAVTNNSGAFNREISDVVSYVECYRKSDLTKKIRLDNNRCLFSYRNSIFKNGDCIITRIKLKLNHDDYLLIAERMNRCLYQKQSTQPITSYSAGSVFKRTYLTPAAKLIDELGLKGYKIKNASVSNMHAGFIVANKSTKSKDVLELIDYIKKKVREKYHIELEEEIEYIKF